MVEKKVAKKAQKKTIKKTPAKKTSKAEKTKSTKTAKSKTKDDDSDAGIVIVDDDIRIDQEKVNEERRAYLEEARSQEAYD